MKRLMTIVFAGFVVFSSTAQLMTMDECMVYALQHSITVSKQQNVLDNADMDYKRSIASLFPSLSAGVSASANFGRSIDPETNNYTNVATLSNSYSLTASMPIFAGLRYVNGIRVAAVARERGYSELQIARDRVAMEVMRAYIDVLYYRGTVKIAEEQLAAARLSLEQAQALYDCGRKSASDVAELSSQEANYDYMLTEQNNNLALSWIRLREVMNYPQDYPLDIADFPETTILSSMVSEEDVLEYALENNAMVVSSELAVRESKLNLLIANGAWFPTISLSAGINTSYFVNFDNREAYPGFSSQFKNNSGEYISLSMSIPIFSNLSRRASVRYSRNALRNAELEREAVRNTVESEVVQACRQMEGYRMQYNMALRKVEASRLAYNGIVAKYNEGLVTTVELQNASATLLQAQSDCLRSRLQYMIEKRMVDYYSGIPFVME
ncbi:MAG: TolC family protein [Bacteroidales bacterium]|nr:TolC family protein [Bacteroidales bacterium]